MSLMEKAWYMGLKFKFSSFLIQAISKTELDGIAFLKKKKMGEKELRNNMKTGPEFIKCNAVPKLKVLKEVPLKEVPFSTIQPWRQYHGVTETGVCLFWKMRPSDRKTGLTSESRRLRSLGSSVHREAAFIATGSVRTSWESGRAALCLPASPGRQSNADGHFTRNQAWNGLIQLWNI